MFDFSGVGQKKWAVKKTGPMTDQLLLLTELQTRIFKGREFVSLWWHFSCNHKCD